MYTTRAATNDEIAIEAGRLDKAWSAADSAWLDADAMYQSGTSTSSSQIARYKRDMEIAEANHANFIAALPYITVSSQYIQEAAYINDVGNARENRDLQTAASKTDRDTVGLLKQGGAHDWRQYTFMTEAERIEYNRLWKEEGAYVASAYLEALTKGALNSRYGRDIAQGNSDIAEIGAQVVYGFKNAVGNIPELWSDTPHDPSAWEYASQYMMDDEDSKISQLLQKVAYRLGGKVPSWMISGINYYAPNKGKTANDLFNGLVSIGEAYEEAKSKGYTGTKAQFFGFFLGMENIAKDKLRDYLVNEAKQFFK